MTKETLRQIEAFDYYYALGDENRSLRQVANHIGAKLQTVKIWSSKFKWADRVLERDQVIGQRLQEQTDQMVLSLKEKNRQIVEQLVEKAMEDVRSGKIKVENIQDYERIFRMVQIIDPAGGSGGIDNWQSLKEIIKESLRNR